MRVDNRLMKNLALASILGLLSHIGAGLAVGYFARLPVSNTVIRLLGDSDWLWPVAYGQDLALNTILSLPLACLICLLTPRRLIVYCIAAVGPTFVWWNWAWLGNPDLAFAWRHVIAGWAIQWGSLALALFLVQGRVGGDPPNRSLQRTLDPAAPSADAKGTSASSAAELRC